MSQVHDREQKASTGLSFSTCKAGSWFPPLGAVQRQKGSCGGWASLWDTGNPTWCPQGPCPHPGGM